MDESLEMYNTLRLNQEKKKKMNCVPVTKTNEWKTKSNETKKTKNFQQTEILNQMTSQVISIKHLKKS